MALVSMTMMAQSYDDLWKKAREANNKDLPRTEIEVLEQIQKKAEGEKNYGQLLAAGLKRAGLQTQISPDSLEVEVARLEAKTEQYDTVDPTLAAVCRALLGKIYTANADLGEDHGQKGREYYDKSLANPSLLAACKCADYKPLVLEGVNSIIFDNDMLHVIGLEAKRYNVLHDYYERTGNRAAACLMALKIIQGKERQMRKKEFLASLDSLLALYGDLEVAGEVAIERFMAMDDDATVEYRYGEEILQKYPNWQNMNRVRNSLEYMKAPKFNVEYGSDRFLPYRQRVVEVKEVRNVKSLTVRAWKLKADGESQFYLWNSKQLDEVKKKIEGDVVQVKTREYHGVEPWVTQKDSIILDGMRPGVYLFEVSADAEDLSPQYNVGYVSDVFVMWEERPNNTIRFSVVNSTTGQPLPKAFIKLSIGDYWEKPPKTQVLKTDNNGEAFYTYEKRRPWKVYAYTVKDQACNEISYSGNFSYTEPSNNSSNMSVYTDRSIYRPGQTVHAAVIAFQRYDREEFKVRPQQQVTVRLLDANSQKIEEKIVTTDDFGKASVDFSLPTSGLTGNFSIKASGAGSGSASFSVEEYKRPTFQLSFDDYKEKYANGDTIVVKGYAKTYSGVPVQGAKVAYNVMRRKASWCWWSPVPNTNDVMLRDTVVTDDQGAFYMRMPIILPKEAALIAEGEKDEYWRRGVFYNFQATATVTDMGGESHSGSTSVPLGTKTSTLTTNLPSKEMRDSLQTVTYRLLNAAGEPIDGMVKLTIDGKPYRGGKAFAANKPIPLDVLSSGQHTFVATCDGNELTSKVILFSMSDTHPVVQTHDWFYATASTFPSNGNPVYIQFGSSDEAQHVVYSLFAGNTVLESGTLNKSNALTTRSFTYNEKYGDGVTFTCAWVREGKLYQHSHVIAKPDPDKRLKLKWKTFRDRLTPGQQEEWSLTVTTPDGKPADAQLMCTLFDKSLDDIRHHGWSLSTYIYRMNASVNWMGPSSAYLSSSTTARVDHKFVVGMQYGKLNDSYFQGLLYRMNILRIGGIPNEKAGSLRVRGLSRARASEEMDMLAAPMEMVEETAMLKKDVSLVPAVKAAVAEKEADADAPEPQAQMRENLDETAFFYPQLSTDANGEVAIKFTLPESLTTWRFLGIAHDKEMNHGSISGEAIAQKTVMVSPNVPRFVRQGDRATISTRLMSTAEKAITGTAQLQLLDPQTEKVVYATSQPFSIKPQGTSSATFTIEPSVLDDYSLLVARISAQGDGYSDGEQHYLPVLSNKEQVINTLPFTQHGAGTKTIDLTKLFPENTTNHRLTVEYTNHPSWLMVQALPYVADANEHNAISLVSAYYSNLLGQNIINSNPKIRETLDAWKAEEREEGSKGGSLLSQLEKNQELKTLVLNETPWVLDSQQETKLKHDMINFFDKNMMEKRLASTLDFLKKLQNTNGSWSWWEGMRGSLCVTTSVSKTLVRLNTMLGEQSETKDMLKSAFKFMKKEIAKEVAELKKLERKGFKDLRPSETAVDYLYLCALDGRDLGGSAKDDIEYLVKLLSKKTTELTIYGKANSAVILAHNGYAKKAAEYMQSMKEYSVFTEEMGRYYDTRKAFYSWFDYRIPTQVAAIEALRMVTPDDQKTVEEMQRWLLQEKRTTAWSTPVNSVNAVYAFFGKDGVQKMTEHTGEAVIALDGQTMEMSQSTAGLGYKKGSVNVDENDNINENENGLRKAPSNLTIEKADTDTSWGAVYAQFLQPTTEIENLASGITVTREIIPSNPSSAPSSLKVGDRVRVRITIKADRDYDFVQVEDRRAACMEHVGQLSGYHWGYYCAPKDCQTNYYFDMLAKGKHVVETEYFIDREGDYQQGICTVQCAYAPEYYGRTKGEKIKVEK